jgi:hypothetical protein
MYKNTVLLFEGSELKDQGCDKENLKGYVKESLCFESKLKLISLLKQVLKSNEFEPSHHRQGQPHKLGR